MPADRQLPTGGVSENPNLKSPSWGLLNTVFLMLDACRHFTSFPDTLPTGGHHLQVFKTVFLMVDACRHLTSSAISSTAYLKSHISISSPSFPSKLSQTLISETDKSTAHNLTSTAAIENISLFKLKSSNQNHHKLWYLDTAFHMIVNLQKPSKSSTALKHLLDLWKSCKGSKWKHQ